MLLQFQLWVSYPPGKLKRKNKSLMIHPGALFHKIKKEKERKKEQQTPSAQISCINLPQ